MAWHQITYRTCVPVTTVSTRAALRSAARGDLVVPRTRRRLGNRAFCVAGPAAWNSLPPDIRTASTLSTFKNRLKTLKLASCGAVYCNRSCLWVCKSGRACGVRTLLQPARAQCLRLSLSTFFICFCSRILQFNHQLNSSSVCCTAPLTNTTR